MKTFGDQADKWPLDGIRIRTLLKVTDIDLDYHSYEGYEEPHEEPYTQITISGFVLVDAQGGCLFANVQINEKYGYTERVHKIKETFSPGSIHWIESGSFVYGDREILFFESQMKPLQVDDYDATNAFFPILVEDRDQPSAHEFYYSGAIYREGRGKFLGFGKRV